MYILMQSVLFYTNGSIGALYSYVAFLKFLVPFTRMKAFWAMLFGWEEYAGESCSATLGMH